MMEFDARSSGLTRRELIAGMLAAGGAAALGMVHARAVHASAAGAADLALRAHDWDWLAGSWDVRHRRLRERLAGCNEWDEFGGRSVLWLALGGLGTIDDNILELPGGTYRGLTIRAFDPARAQWSIWWLDGRNPARIDPPVRGAFDGDSGTFSGADTFNGRPITVRFRWLDIHGARPHWEQAFSSDGGASWEVNWVNFFTRSGMGAAPLPRSSAPAPRERQDWDFLVGEWRVHNRRLKQRLAGSTQWEEFSSRLVNRPVLGGCGNVGDNLFDFPGGPRSGMSVRAFDGETRQWLSWWLDGASPAGISAPLRGRFENGVGTLLGEDTLAGRAVKVRSQWSRITPGSAHWEQAASADGGATWETNWVSDFVRVAT